MFTITISLLVVAMSLFYYFFLKSKTYWKDRGIRQTSSQFGLLGDMAPTMFRRKTFIDWMNDLYKESPDSRYYGFYMFTKPTLLLRDPELIKQVTVKYFDHFGDHRPFIDEKADPLWANNLLALTGQKWRDMRQVLSPSFTSSKMKSMFVLMSDCSKKFTDFFLEKNQDIVEVELKDVFTRYCTDVIGSTAYGIESDSLRNPDNEFYCMGKEALNFSGIWKSLKLAMMLSCPKVYNIFKMEVFGARINNFFYKLVDDTIRVRTEKNIFRPDMIHLLMQVREGDQKQENENEVVDTGFSTAQEVLKGKASRMQLTNNQIAAQAMIFFFGGFDPSSSLMCFMSYELAINPNIQNRLREEIEKTLANCGGNLTYEALMKMKYMDMVVSETLRKWPTNGALDRVCTKPFTIEPSTPDEKPVHLMPGDFVWAPLIAIHQDEKYYPNPELFDPERFSDENKHKINPLAYLPFGAGPRICLGSRFVLLETKAAMFHILHNFEIVPTQKSQIPLQLSKAPFQMRAQDGLWFGFKRIKT